MATPVLLPVARLTGATTMRRYRFAPPRENTVSGPEIRTAYPVDVVAAVVNRPDCTVLWRSKASVFVQDQNCEHETVVFVTSVSGRRPFHRSVERLAKSAEQVVEEC